MTGPDLADGPQLDVLQRLAYWLIKNGRTETDRSRATDIIGRALPAVPEVADLGDAATVFEYFLQRSGLLREPAPDTVDFLRRGEAALWTLLRRAVAWMPGLVVRWDVRRGLCVAPVAVGFVHGIAGELRPTRQVLLRHAVHRRGPPTGIPYAP